MSGRRGLVALLPAGKCGRPGPGSFPVSLSLASGCSAGCEVLAGEARRAGGPACRGGLRRHFTAAGPGGSARQQQGRTAQLGQCKRDGVENRMQLNLFSEGPSCNVPMRAHVNLLTQGDLSCGV